VPFWLGIDFSGDHHMWREEERRSNVWVATVRERGKGLGLSDLRPVQRLTGPGHPFDRLVALLRAARYAAAAIDAPFSVPSRRCPGASHGTLLQKARRWEVRDRPFAPAAVLLEALTPPLAPPGVKELRDTERGLRVPARATTWAGARSGAAMTAACLTLVARAERPVWPFTSDAQTGLLVEAFPAAQLKAWNLPSHGYNGAAASARRTRLSISRGLAKRIALPDPHRATLLESADALDAVLCAFAGIAVTRHTLAREPSGAAPIEGWIAVHG
jgi:hypothetical protein